MIQPFSLAFVRPELQQTLLTSQDMQSYGQDFLWICKLSGAFWGPFHVSVVSGQVLRAEQQVPLLRVAPSLLIWKELVYRALNQKYAARVSKKPEIIFYICSPLSMEI